MKKIIYSVLLNALLTLAPTITIFGQFKLDVEGEAVTGTNKLARIMATDLNLNYDILELVAPTSPSGDGQFLECQAGTNSTDIRAQINYDGSAYFDNEINIGGQLLLNNEGVNSSAEIRFEDSNDNQTIVIRAKDAGGSNGGDIRLFGDDPLVETIEIDGNWSGTGKGRIVTDELEIEGGSDIAENFDVETNNSKVEPGTLVSIDPENPGKLIVSNKAYDAKVAGIISGANGVDTGLYMGQKGSEADGEHPVALAGRVYVKADADFGKIKPGDLLTTSSKAGHAMKVKSHRKARGAVIGKAMSSLKEGTGYVLVLVSLQ